MMTYHGFNIWAEGVRKAETVDRIAVTEALESGISYQGPGRHHGGRSKDPSRNTRRAHRAGEEPEVSKCWKASRSSRQPTPRPCATF